MLYVLPPETILRVLSYLPIPSLLLLPVLSRQWSHFFTINQSDIFHHAALLHGHIQPHTLSLEDALSVNTGRPWAGSKTWKDFCHRSYQLRKNWEGKGRAVARVLSPPGSNPHRIKVDEKAGICITTHMFGGLSVIHLFSSTVLWCLPQSYVRGYAHCEYDSGYLVFDRTSGEQEVWRLASDISAEDEVAVHSPPDDGQMRASARAAAVYHQYAPRGQFRPWALLGIFKSTFAYRLAYPTLICSTLEQAFLYDVRTGVLVQTINISLQLQGLVYVDVNERHAFICERTEVHVFSRESGTEVLRVPADATIQCSQHVEDPILESNDKFIAQIPVTLEVVESRPRFIAAHVSRDGRDLVVLSPWRRVIFIPDFERICRGETSLERAGLSLTIRTQDVCCYLGFEHGRVCVSTTQRLYIFAFGSDLSARAVVVQPFKSASDSLPPISCMQLTDRHIYFTWVDELRRPNIPLFQDAEDAQELAPPIIQDVIGEFEGPPIAPTLDEEFQLWVAQRGPIVGRIGKVSVGCIDFTLMPESSSSDG